MGRTMRVAFVVSFVLSLLVVIPGDSAAVVPGGIGRIAFLSNADHPSEEIYVRDFAGSTPLRITSNTDADYTPRWSPDGTRIAFSRAFGTRTDVLVMDPDGANELNLTLGVGSSNTPLDWSPDGTRILFVSDRGGNYDLWVMYADGSDPHQLTSTIEPEWGASWSPDGSHIVMSRTAGGSADLWMMKADGSNVTRITNTIDNESSPTWSPDGSRIAFTSDVGGRDIWVMNADGSNAINLTNSALYSSWEPAWSPDGSKIAYTSDRDGDWDVWMMNPDGSDQAHLTDNPANERAVTWEPVNRLPVAVDDEVHSSRGGSIEIAVLANDTDPDGEQLSIRDVTRMPDEGSVVINQSGTITYTHDGSKPGPGSVPVYTATFEYQIEDTRLGTATATVAVWIHPAFDDVPATSIFVGDITWLAETGITKGCNPPDNTMYCPGDSVTRGQMAAFLVRALGLTDDSGGDLYVDDNGSVFEGDIDKMGTAGITRGCNPPVNDRYCPGEPVTRGQMAAFLARAYGLSSGASSDLFVDDNGSVFEGDIDKLGMAGVSRGCNPPVNDKFCPDEQVTRGQMAAFLHRATILTLD
jgi:Tol biopolymer transport system component